MPLPDQLERPYKCRPITRPNTRREGRGTEERGTPVPPKNGGRVAAGGFPGSHRRSVKSPTETGRPNDPRPLLQLKAGGNSVPCLHNRRGGGVRDGRGKGTRVSRLGRRSGIPSPAAGFRRRALFQEAASRQLRASLAPSATTTARSGPFGPTAPPHNFEAELRTHDCSDLAYGIS